MTENVLVRLFEHNHWANLEILKACSALTDRQLDAEPESATKGTIRLTLRHLVNSQEDYLATLARREPRFDWELPPPLSEMEQGARLSGEGLIAFATEAHGPALEDLIHKEDGYTIEPWVVLLQALNHATEHREQIKSMLSALGMAPPRIDGWQYGRVTHGLIPPAASREER